MKILLSPSKTQNYKNPENFSFDFFKGKNIKLESEERTFIRKKIIKILSDRNISIENLKNKNTMNSTPAIFTYNGLVFKQMDFTCYENKHYEYLNNNLIILSALYGILKPFEDIRPYRLDFNTKTENVNLYDMWKIFTDEFFKCEDLIIDLASKEFSKMVLKDKVTINFRQFDGKEYKNKGTYGKMSRGKFLNQMVINNVTTIEAIKKVKFDNYAYEEKISSKSNLYFVEYKN